VHGHGAHPGRSLSPWATYVPRPAPEPQASAGGRVAVPSQPLGRDLRDHTQAHDAGDPRDDGCTAFGHQPSARVLTPYLPYLVRRWRESGADSMQLWREIRAFGYAHSARTVCRFITRLRRAADVGDPPEPQGTPYTCTKGPSARMVRGAHLQAWMAEALHSGIEALARFARGLQEDLAAVTAGLTHPWSNGVTEGHVHRLKLVKRQGYGRAGFALLRQRVLQAA
jgi:hypothetical protein